MLSELWHGWKTIWRFRGYRPQAVTFSSFWKWIYQFAPKDRKIILTALEKVCYLSEKECRDALVSLNEALLIRLQEEGIPFENILYVQIDDAGSSSPVMLNLIRDASQLERRGCKLVDSNNLALFKMTDKMESGAIIYVDDFVGSGAQFTTVRGLLGNQIVGSFSEFLLAAVICEEGSHEVSKRGVEPIAHHIDRKLERPLHPYSTILSNEDRETLVKLCSEIDLHAGLGFHRLSTSTVLYRNAPDTFPLIFRGSPGQERMGILPRVQDLPVKPLRKG